MFKKGSITAGLIVLSLLAPAAGAQTQGFCKTKGTQGLSCAEKVTLPPGFENSSDSALLADAVKSAGTGGLCCGQVAVASRAVTIYRAWTPHYEDQSKQPPGYHAAYQFGNWWSPTAPSASRATYRNQDDICAEYDSLTVYSQCDIRKGTTVVIGPGQSVKCDESTMIPQSSTLQIYIPNPKDREGTQGRLDSCDTYVWPPSPISSK